MLPSLAQTAELLNDVPLLLRVKAFYDNGLCEMRDEIGWSPELAREPQTEHGECNNTGDIFTRGQSAWCSAATAMDHPGADLTFFQPLSPDDS